MRELCFTFNVKPLKSKLVVAKELGDQSLQGIQTRDAEITRLNEEVAQTKSDAQESYERLVLVQTEYEELKRQYVQLSESKNGSDKQVERFLKEMSDEEGTASLGTSVVRA